MEHARGVGRLVLRVYHRHRRGDLLVGSLWTYSDVLRRPGQGPNARSPPAGKNGPKCVAVGRGESMREMGGVGRYAGALGGSKGSRRWGPCDGSRRRARAAAPPPCVPPAPGLRRRERASAGRQPGCVESRGHRLARWVLAPLRSSTGNPLEPLLYVLRPCPQDTQECQRRARRGSPPHRRMRLQPVVGAPPQRPEAVFGRVVASYRSVQFVRVLLGPRLVGLLGREAGPRR
jgi:hypothetical protein